MSTMSIKTKVPQLKVRRKNSEEEKLKQIPNSQIFYLENSIAFNYNNKRDALKSAVTVERLGKLRKAVVSPITNLNKVKDLTS